jgi:hypothetical protein
VGAYAGLLLWSGSPLEDSNMILDEDKLELVTKDGLVYRNTLAEGDSPMFGPARTPLTRGQLPL